MKQFKKPILCPVEATLSLIGGKYKPLILWHLKDQPLHYMELRRLIPAATPKMLAQQLRQLEEDGLIRRRVIPETPPRTEYSLTDFGRTVIPVLNAACDWGTDYLAGKLDGSEPKTVCCNGQARYSGCAVGNKG